MSIKVQKGCSTQVPRALTMLTEEEVQMKESGEYSSMMQPRAYPGGAPGFVYVPIHTILLC